MFVGGIPQSIDADDLHNMFSTIGKVKKAWLQFNAFENRDDAPWSTKRPHRGFGFVVFHEKLVVDKLLGDEFSRFICFGEAIKFEVKRAVGSVAPWKASASGNPRSKLSEQKQELHSSRLCSSSQSQRDALPSGFQSWQRDSWQQPSEDGVLPDLPQVPPFPYAEPLLGDIAPAALTALHGHPNHPQALHSECSLISHGILHGIVGQQPCNREELELVLRQAVPDRYED